MYALCACWSRFRHRRQEASRDRKYYGASDMRRTISAAHVVIVQLWRHASRDLWTGNSIGGAVVSAVRCRSGRM